MLKGFFVAYFKKKIWDENFGFISVSGSKSALDVSLTYYMPVLLLYRNQSIDLLSKLINWSLFEGNIGI